jgi:hypothetical protein
MFGWLIGIGALATVIGLILTILQAGGNVSADTQFGDFSGEVGPVALILGIVLMAIGGLA